MQSTHLQCTAQWFLLHSRILGNSLVVQWLGLHAFTSKDLGSIPGQGIKILQAAKHGQDKRIVQLL